MISLKPVQVNVNFSIRQNLNSLLETIADTREHFAYPVNNTVDVFNLLLNILVEPVLFGSTAEGSNSPSHLPTRGIRE